MGSTNLSFCIYSWVRSRRATEVEELWNTQVLLILVHSVLNDQEVFSHYSDSLEMAFCIY